MCISRPEIEFSYKQGSIYMCVKIECILQSTFLISNSNRNNIRTNILNIILSY
ncbi:hypothetical protein Hanom_Chr14g01292151 [Helianthus anomalus]